MRKGLTIAVLVGIVALIAYHLSRPKPLRPIIVTWQEVGRVIIVVDLDADGNDELLVEDQSGQLWWVQFRLPTPIRQKLPVTRDTRDGFRSHANCFANFRGQIWPFVQYRTRPRRAFLITRQGGKWVLKDLGKFSFDDYDFGCAIWVTDADHDGQVNDVVVWRGRTRTVFSRLKDGTIVERPALRDWRADLDGDGKDDEVYEMLGRASYMSEVRVHFASGRKLSLKPCFPIAITDLDGDKVAEIVGAEIVSDKEHRFLCWHYENGKWSKSESPKFVGSFVLIGDTELRFPLFWDEKGAYLLAMTLEGQHAKIWDVRWQKGKWTKRLMGKVPERNVSYIYLVRKGQDWMVGGWASPPKWQKWLWEKVGQPLQRFLPFLREPRGRFFAYGWDGKRRWALLGRWRNDNLLDVKFADMDGDGKREISIAFPKRVLVAKFEDGRWCTGWVEGSFADYRPIEDFYGFRYGGREWAIYQDRDSHRCVAIALEGDSQQSKRHQPQRRD